MNDEEQQRKIEYYERSRKMRKELSNLVVKDNALVQKARYNLSTTQQKFLAYLISKIKPEDTDLTPYEVRVEDFCTLTGIEKDWFYSEFIKLVDDFDNNHSFWVDNDKELYKFRWFSDTRYLKGRGTVKVTLAHTLKEYLIGLTESFTEYELYNIMALKSKYAIRLFELFKSYSYQHQKEFETENLKELLDATNYVNFNDFKKRVIEPSIKEINEFTELTIEYNTINKGRKIIAVRFIINRKERLENYVSYLKTLEKINENNNVIKGQLSFDFDGNIYEEWEVKRNDFKY